MAEYSSIHLENMQRLVEEMGDGGKRLVDTAALLREKGRSCSFSHPAVDRIGEIGGWAHEQVPHLQRRLTLASATSHGRTGRAHVARVKEGHETKAQAVARGRRLAKEFAKYDESGKGQVAGWTKVVKALGDDPDACSAFFGALKPQQVMLISGAMGELTDPDAAKVVDAYSVALGHAFADRTPPPGFKALVKVLETPLTKDEQRFGAWERLALFQKGHFPAGVLARMARANALTDLQDGYDGRWDVGRNRLGLSDNPAILAFEMIAKDPAAARHAFDGVNLSAITKAVYGSPRFDRVVQPFAAAMLAATGSGNEKAGHHSKAAIDFTFRFIQASAAVKSVPGPMQHTLGKIAAKWAPELVTGSYLEDGASRGSSKDRPGHFDAALGVHPSFYLSPQVVYRFVHGFAGSDGNTHELDDQVSRMFATSLAAAAKVKKAHPGSAAWQHTLDFYGDLAGIEYVAKDDTRDHLDELDKQSRKLLSDVFTNTLGNLPGAKVVTTLGWKVVNFAAGKAAAKWVAGDPNQTRTALLHKSENQAAFLAQYVLAKQLVDAGYPGSSHAPHALLSHGHLKSPSAIAHDPHLIELYQKWTDATDTGKDTALDNVIASGNDALLAGHGKADSMKDQWSEGW